MEDILTDTLLSSQQSILKVRCAILGLAAIGSRKSSQKIERYVNNPSPSIKKSALQGLTKLIGEKSLLYLFDGMKDESTGVAKESARLINKLKINVSVNVLIDIVEKVSYPHTLNVCLSGVKRINKWNKLIFLLKVFNLLKAGKSIQIKKINNEIIKWNEEFNRSSSQPSEKQMKQIVNEFNLCKNEISNEANTFLEFTIKSFINEE